MADNAGVAAILILSFALTMSACTAGPQVDKQKGAAEMHLHDRDETGDSETKRAMEFLACLGNLDFEGAAAFLDEEAVLDLPYAGSGYLVTGRSQVIAFFHKTMTDKVGHITYQLDHAYPSREAGVIVLEVSTKVEASDGSAANRLVTIFRFQHGKIVLFREYFNPAPIAAVSR